MKAKVSQIDSGYNYSYFELRRLSHDVVYQFDRMMLPNGEAGYKRRDKDLWIVFKTRLGWVAYDEEHELLMGRPWNTMPLEQDRDHPPEGEWVSKKGAKSYVYDLVYGIDAP